MTISSTTRKAGPYTGNGSASAFPFAFKVFTAADLYVVKTNTTLGADSVLVLGTDYTVALNADQNANPGGTITLTAGVLAAGYNLTITSSLQYLQPTDLTNQGGFYPSVITNALDRLTIFCQQLFDAVNRSLKVSVSTPAGVQTTLPPPAANKLIQWDSSGTNLQNADPTTLATLVAFGTTNADKFSGDGATTQFALSSNPSALNNLDVSVGGVTQRPGIDYTWTSGTTIAFTTAPPVGTNNVLVRYMQGLPQGAADSAATTFIQAGTGAVQRTAQDKLREYVSLYDFMTAAQIADAKSMTGSMDLTAAISAAIAASNGRTLFAPAGKYSHGALQVPKNVLLRLQGEFDSYNNTEGTVFNYTGTGIGFQVGVDDGNPDTTGPARGGRISGIHFTTTSGQTAIRLQNTALAVVENCRTRNFSGKVLDLRGNVITKIRDNDIAGTTAGSSCYGIWCDDEYFGNYVVDICDNHIFQVNFAGRFSEGRSLTVHNNIVENIRPGATGGVWTFATSGYISTASFQDNYYENHRGYVFEGASFTGAILNLIVKGEDAWGSADAGNVNPGVGNLPKTKVFAHDIRGNFFVDAAWNTKAYLALPAVYPATSVFDTATTALRGQVTNKEYEDDLAHILGQNELLRSAGDFADLTGGVAGSFTKTGGTPTGWTNLASPSWQLVADGICGTFVCYVPGAGDYDRCSRVVSLSPVAAVRYFAIAFTVKGWAALRVDGNAVYDSGSSLSSWTTVYVTFSVASNASSFTLKFGTNAANPFYVAEARLVEVGSAEVNEPGTMNSACQKAVKRLLKRGSY